MTGSTSPGPSSNWGTGQRLWCALGNSRDYDGAIEEGGYRVFIRANTRAEAAKGLGLTGAHLIVPIRDIDNRS